MVEQNSLQVPFVDLKTQYTALKSEVDAAFAEVFENTSFVLGDAVARFEDEFATYCGAKHAIGLDSGLSALDMLLRAYGIGPGDEVITASNTFIATVLAISSAGATPVLVDCDPVTYNISCEAIEAAITPRTRAIIPVHLYGQPVDMDALLAIARSHSLLVIEDACQAHGATYGGNRVGSTADGAAFSFYPGKNLGAYGDGGMAVTNDAQVADTLRMLRNYGQRQKYHHEVVGYNRRLDSLQAAALSVKLRYLDQWNAARQAHAERYRTLLADAPVTTPAVLEGVQSVWHLFVIRSENRDGLQAHLSRHGVSTGIHYPVPVHLHRAYESLGYRRGSFPVAEAYATEILSLPMYPELPQSHIDYTADIIQDFLLMRRSA